MSKIEFKWTTVAQMPITTAGMRTLVDLAKDETIDQTGVTEILVKMADSTTEESRGALIANLSTSRRNTVLARLQMLETERVKTGLLVLEYMFTNIASDHHWDEVDQTSPYELMRHIGFNAFAINPESLGGLCAGAFIFLRHFNNPQLAAYMGASIFGQIREEYKPDCDYGDLIRKAIDETMRAKGYAKLSFREDKKDEIIHGFYNLAWRAKFGKARYRSQT